MRPRTGLAAGLSLCVLTLGACRDDGVGYVEIRSMPVVGRGPAIYLNTTKLDASKSGVTILRQAVGTAKLQTENFDGNKISLCNVTIKKNRITTITLMTTERSLRCQCMGTTVSPDSAGARTCVS